MPIPKLRREQILEGSIPLCRADAVFEPALYAAREGVLAMLSLGEQTPRKTA